MVISLNILTAPEVLNLSMNMYRYSIMTNFAGENVQEIIYLKEEDLK